ncbi:MAG: aminopeptidase P family protein, partial [Candidatus Nanopelagicales bacterium]
MSAQYAARRQRLIDSWPETDDGMLVTRLVNVRYLSGFTGSNAALLLTRDRAVLATDGRYVTQAGQESPDTELLVDRRCASALTAKAGKDGIRRLLFEAHDVTVHAYEGLVSAAGGAALVADAHRVEGLRRVKDETEITALQQACAIGDRALARLLDELRPGQTEREIARRLESLMYAEGADALSFDTIVAAGPNSAIPHHRPTTRVVEPGEFLKLDFGAAYDGYHADMTRTVVVGAEPADWQREAYALVRRAQAAGCAALAPDVGIQVVDAAARDVIVAAGYGEHFPHGLGHGVGLEIHEAPLIGYSATGILDDRTPVTVEPGIYLPGRGGVRIEDTLVVRGGGPQLL